MPLKLTLLPLDCQQGGTGRVGVDIVDLRKDVHDRVNVVRKK